MMDELTTDQITEHATEALKLIRDDILAGLVPADPTDVTGFSSLHDHVDANDYLQAVPGGGDIPNLADDPAGVRHVNDVTEVINRVMTVRTQTYANLARGFAADEQESQEEATLAHAKMVALGLEVRLAQLRLGMAAGDREAAAQAWFLWADCTRAALYDVGDDGAQWRIWYALDLYITESALAGIDPTVGLLQPEGALSMNDRAEGTDR